MTHARHIEAPDTCSPVPKLNRIVCKLKVFGDEHAETELFDGLAAFRFANKCFCQSWEAQVFFFRRGSWSAAHHGSSCMVRLFLLFAWIIVGATLVADGRGGQSDHSGKTALFGRNQTKLSDTRIYIHIQPCSQIQVSHS